MKNRLRVLRAEREWSQQDLAERLEENEAVVRAIRSKNSAQASAEMRRHILREGQRMGIELNIPDDHLSR